MSQRNLLMYSPGVMARASRLPKETKLDVAASASPLQEATVESLLLANTWKAASEPIICQHGSASKPALFLRGSFPPPPPPPPFFHAIESIMLVQGVA